MYDYTVTREALERELAHQNVSGVDTNKLTIAVQMAMVISRAHTRPSEMPPPRCQSCDD